MSGNPNIVARQATVGSPADQAITAALRTAVVIITVDKFKNVMFEVPRGKKRGVDHRMRLKHSHARVWTEGTNPVELHIRPGGATIQFVIVPPSGKNNVYYPLGIAFVRTGGLVQRGTPHKSRLAHLNFAQSKILPQGNTLFITDAYKDGRKDDTFEFSIIIQRAEDGALGIIDPPIIHDPI